MTSMTAMGGGLRPNPATALGVASSGAQAAEERLGEDAQSIATHGPDVASMVDLDVQTTTVRALVQVIRASDEMTRSLIDVLA
jgi:hypothetical protein